MTLAHRDLVRGCVEVLDTFNPEIKALEDHVTDYIEEQGVSTAFAVKQTVIDLK